MTAHDTEEEGCEMTEPYPMIAHTAVSLDTPMHTCTLHVHTHHTQPYHYTHTPTTHSHITRYTYAYMYTTSIYHTTEDTAMSLYVCVYTCTLYLCVYTSTLSPYACVLEASHTTYEVPTISRLLKIIGLFCKRALQKRLYSAKETLSF